MTTVKITVSQTVGQWMDAQVREGHIPSPDAYVRDLIRRDREQRGEILSPEELSDLIRDARQSGVSLKTLDAIFSEAEAKINY